MFLELARPVTLLGNMLSLLAVFHTAFLGQETDFSQRIYDSSGMLLLAAGFALLGGLAFRQGNSGSKSAEIPLTETFPVRVFFWTTGILVLTFLLSWYLETHCIFYRDIHF